jgi:hypothetical protein
MAGAVMVLLLNLTSVFVAETKAGGESAAPAGTNWGEPVGGVSVRLTSEKASWEWSQAVILKFSVRNQGEETVSVARNQLGGELEADGVWYSWTNVVNGPLVELAPGERLDNITVNFDSRWDYGSVPFPFGPGSRTVRFAPLARRPGGQAIRAVSNPVEFEVLLPVLPGVQNNTATFSAEDNAAGSSAAIEIRGRLVDDETGGAVTNFWLQSGTASPEKLSEVVWSQSYQGPIVTESLGRFVVQVRRTGQVWRVLAEGYQPQTVPAQPTNAGRPSAELLVRLKRAGELRGVVLDYMGQPVPGARVLLTNTEARVLPAGPPTPMFGNNSTTTDATGRFALRQSGRSDMKVIVVSADGHLVWPVRPSETSQELKITLPQPASLLVRYDIPGDPPDTVLGMSFLTRDLEMPLWQGVNSGVSATVPNHRQTLLTNLTPGSYIFIRFKTLRGEEGGRDLTNILDHQTLLLEPGRTQEVNLVRLVGYPVQGQVTMRDQAQVPPGSISVYVAGGGPRGLGSDGAIFGKDGRFQTALLAPGAYTVMAEAYAPETIRAAGANGRIGLPDFLAWASVTVAADAAPAPMKIELLPYSSASNSLAGPRTATNASVPAPRPLARQPVPRAAPGTISGRVVDDETDEAIVDFLVQSSTPNPMRTNDVFWNGYSSGNLQRPGIFSGLRSPTPQWVLRFLAPGYVPQILTEQSVTNLPASGLEIRLKRGEALQGVVLDGGGRPVAGARVLVATTERVYLMDGKFQYGVFRGGSTNTDNEGRFVLRGEGGPVQKVVIVSPDGHLIWPAIQSETGQEWKITLPKPGALIVRYDIPGDAPEAKPELYLWPQDKEMPLWTNISFGQTVTVSNGGQIVLTNLTPGTYNFRRYKREGEQGAESEQQTIVVEAGQTQKVDMVRTNGQHVRGQVIGLDLAKASGGYIFVKSAEATGLPWPQRSRNEQNEYKFRTFDVSQFGADGSFETAMLLPGAYTVIANVYPPQDRSGGMPYRNNNPDFVAVAKVTVTTEPMPPVTLKLAQAPYVDIAGSGVDDETGAPVPDLMIESGKVNPDKPDEIIWNQGYQGTSQGGRFLLWGLKAGSALRFRANGYLPQAITRNEIIASRHTANLQVRMKRGGELHGVVLDHAGWPAAGATVYLAPLDLGFVRLGPLGWSTSATGSVTNWAHTFATTDAAGRFSLRGVETNGPRVIAVSVDGRMVQPMQASGPGQDLKITLPEPATLIVHYDILGDVAEADFGLTLRTNELELPLWKYVTLKPWGAVPNGGQTVLSNLTPGAYDFARSRRGGVNSQGRAYVFGDPPELVQTDRQRVVLQSGQTQQVNLVRAAGQRVQGKVTGLEPFTNTAGSFLYVASATAIRSTQDFTTNKLEPCFDTVSLGRDGLFQTALLEPGTYTLVAEVYLWGEIPNRETFADDEPQYGGMMFMRPQRLALVASAKVTVTTNAAPPPVRMALRPLVDAEVPP